MFKGTFVGRNRELTVLDNLWESDRASLLILYGRRRVGKTRLLTHWLQKEPKNRLYWVAEPASTLTQLRSFSQALLGFVDPDSPVPPDFTYATWEQALRQVAFFAQQRRLALFIDEVTYLIDVNPEFVGVLQKSWDRWLSDANLMLSLSGSQMGLMQQEILDYKAPLYGRATAQMQLPPLPFGNSRQYFPTYSARDRVHIYAMWGGVPAYWERINPDKPVLENLRDNILPSHAWMVDESRILLQDFITDLHNYVGIMQAISDTGRQLGHIGKRTGLTSGKASFYLSVLRDTEFVVRRVPITQRGTDSRRGRYHITDPYLRFFYRFISASQSKLALGEVAPVMRHIEKGLSDFVGNNTWEELCREWLLRASANGDIPVPIDEVGSEWGRNFMINVVGISDSEKTLVLGKCFWNAQPASSKAFQQIVDLTSSIVPIGDEWTVYYIGFSASGWTMDAHLQAEAIATAAKPSRGKKKWRSVGARLVNLDQLDEDLHRWTNAS